MTGRDAPLVINGWSIYSHPVFLAQLGQLIDEVEARKRRNPGGYRKKNCSKRLAAVFRLVTETIPADPASAVFRQGGTLGKGRKHWFRAKFFQQYRLFFRYDAAARTIVLAWVNDGQTLRAYGSKTDAYATFRKMLSDGNPPDDFDALLKQSMSVAKEFTEALKVR